MPLTVTPLADLKLAPGSDPFSNSLMTIINKQLNAAETAILALSPQPNDAQLETIIGGIEVARTTAFNACYGLSIASKALTYYAAPATYLPPVGSTLITADKGELANNALMQINPT